jgi:hypothetical protein
MTTLCRRGGGRTAKRSHSVRHVSRNTPRSRARNNSKNNEARRHIEFARQVRELLDKRGSELAKEQKRIQKLRKRTDRAFAKAFVTTQIAEAHGNGYLAVVPELENNSVNELSALLRAVPPLGTTKMNAVENEMKRLGF